MVRPFRYYEEIKMKQMRRDPFEKFDKMIEDLDRRSTTDFDKRMKEIFGNKESDKDDMMDLIREKLEELKNNDKRSVSRSYGSIEDIIIKRRSSIFRILLSFVVFPLIFLFLFMLFSSLLPTSENMGKTEKHPQTLEQATETPRNLKKL